MKPIKLGDGGRPVKTMYGWVKGLCETCRKKRDCCRGNCFVCRHPVLWRPLLEAGIPSSSTGVLVGLIRKCGSVSQAKKLLTTVHPVLMENLKIVGGPAFKVRDKRYRWKRHGGWELQK
jgi:hypothetical protein